MESQDFLAALSEKQQLKFIPEQSSRITQAERPNMAQGERLGCLKEVSDDQMDWPVVD